MTERKPTTREELRRRSRCKRRYARANLTIHRWGGIASVRPDSELSKVLEAYKSRKADAEQVAWTFVRSRIVGHTASFDWETADLGRLIVLVTECSESPRLKARNAEDLAKELVRVHDEQLEDLRRLTDQLGRSLAGIRGLGRMGVFPSVTSTWAEQQRQVLAKLSGAFPSSTAQRLAAGIGRQSATEAMKSLGLARANREMFPLLELSKAPGVSPLALSMLREQVRLPDSVYTSLSRSLAQSLAAQGSVIAPSLSRLSRSQTFTINDLVRAAREGAMLAQREGSQADAEELTALTAEVVEVAKNPSIARLEKTVEDLAERLEERLDEMQREGKQDQQINVTLALFLFYLSTYLALFIWLLDRLQEPR